MTVAELAEAVEQELKKVRVDVRSWGLDPEGESEVLRALAAFQDDTNRDLSTHLQYHGAVDVCGSLKARLENVKNLSVANAAAFQGARRCTWLADWMATASPSYRLQHTHTTKKPQLRV